MHGSCVRDRVQACVNKFCIPIVCITRCRNRPSDCSNLIEIVPIEECAVEGCIVCRATAPNSTGQRTAAIIHASVAITSNHQ